MGPAHETIARTAHRRVLARPPLLAGIVIVVMLAATSAAMAFVAGPPRPWPHPIRIYNPTVWQSTMSTAAGAWNRSGVNVRFTFVRRAADADVVVIADDAALAHACLPKHDCIGYSSQIGYRGSTRGPVRLFLPSAGSDEPLGAAAVTATAAHELGHVLGLRHREGCSIMNSQVLKTSCRGKILYPTPATYLCGPMRADVDAVVKLYGGRRSAAYRPDCADPTT